MSASSSATLSTNLGDSNSLNKIDLRCYYKLFALVALGVTILGIFWFGSRYPQLFGKMDSLPTYEVYSFVSTSQLLHATAKDSFLWRVVTQFVNWIYSMRVGMTFGLSMGALLHTVSAFYPLKLTENIFKNTLKGIMVGAPAGVCVNCAVPVACGITRGKNKIETALGFMFSSPTLNFVVVSMVFSALPWQFGMVHYSMVTFVLLAIVPLLAWLYQRDFATSTADSAVESAGTCELPLPKPACEDTLGSSIQLILKTYGKNLWDLIKTAVPMMLMASAVSAVAVEVIPFDVVFKQVSFLSILLTTMVTVLLPVPIAMEVLVAHHLFATNVPTPYIMVFLVTLGTFSMLPMIYLWQEVSKKLAVTLYGLFVVLGVTAAYAIQFFIQ